MLKPYLNMDLAGLTARFITNVGTILPLSTPTPSFTECSTNLTSSMDLKFQWEWIDWDNQKLYLYAKYKHNNYKNNKYYMLSYRLPAITMRLTQKINPYYCDNDIKNFTWGDIPNTSRNIFIEDCSVLRQLKLNIRDVTRYGLKNIRDNIRMKTISKLFSKHPPEFSVETLVELFKMTYCLYDVLPHTIIKNSNDCYNVDDNKKRVIPVNGIHSSAHEWKPEIYVNGKMIQPYSSPFNLSDKFYFHQDYKVIYDVIIDRITFEAGVIYPLFRIKTVYYNKINMLEEIFFEMQLEMGKIERELDDAKLMCCSRKNNEINRIVENANQLNQQFANKISNLSVS